jgi:glycosyltransferase involved in cell wall biosynthesis
MHVLFPLTEPILVGKARFVAIVNTSAALARAGTRVTLLLPGPPEAVARYAAEDLGFTLPPGLEVVRTRGWHRALGHPVTWNRITIGSALRVIDRSRGSADVVHVRHEKLALALARRRRAPRFVFEAHAIAADYERELHRSERRIARADARMRAILGGASGLVSVSRGLEAEIVRRYGYRGPAVVARSGFDPEKFPRSWSDRGEARSNGGSRVVYVGRLGAWKAVGSLIDALGRLPDVRLVLVGSGEEQDMARLREAARAAGAEARLEIAGRVTNREVASIVASADVAVHALPGDLSIATRDTSPLKLLEYLAVGIPVVATDVPSIREIVEDGTSALLVPPGDPDALASTIRRLLSDSGLRKRLSAAGSAIAARHTWEERARVLIRLYETVVGGGGA